MTFIFLLSNQLVGQVVQGTVFDLCTGDPIAGHTIRISDINGTNSWTATTGHDGTYSVSMYQSTLTEWYRITADGTDNEYLIRRGPGFVTNRNFYVLPQIQNRIILTTCEFERDPLCGEDPNDDFRITHSKPLSRNQSSPTPLGCGFQNGWRVLAESPNSGSAYGFRVIILGGQDLDIPLYTSNWKCSEPQPSPQCHPHSSDMIQIDIQDELDDLPEGTYNIRLELSCCNNNSTTTHVDGFIHWAPNVVPINVDFKFTANTVVENANNDAIIDGQLDECYTSLPGALLGGISGGIVFNGFAQNNAVKWSKVEIYEVDCILGIPGNEIYSNTWVTSSGNQPNPFSFAEVREDPNDPLSPPYFLNPANVDGKCFSLTFTAKNSCNEASHTQYFTVPSHLIFQRPIADFSEESMMAENSLKVYPSPFHNDLYIERGMDSKVERCMIEIIDGQGRVVMHERIDQPASTIHLTTGHLTNGVYFYRVQLDDFISTGKIVK